MVSFIMEKASEDFRIVILHIIVKNTDNIIILFGLIGQFTLIIKLITQN